MIAIERFGERPRMRDLRRRRWSVQLIYSARRRRSPSGTPHRAAPASASDRPSVCLLGALLCEDVQDSFRGAVAPVLCDEMRAPRLLAAKRETRGSPGVSFAVGFVVAVRRCAGRAASSGVLSGLNAWTPSDSKEARMNEKRLRVLQTRERQSPHRLRRRGT